MNKVVISGNITKNLELRSTESGKHFVGFSIAINEGTKDKPITHFINCNAWENNADFISKYFSKGRKILIEGSLKTNKYTKDGKDYTSTYVLVNHCEFMDSKKEEQEEEFVAPDEVLTDNFELPF